MFRSRQVRIAPAPIDEQGLVPDELETVLKGLVDGGTPPKFIYTIPTHHNPTGSILSLERRNRLLELAGEFDTLVVEDHCYADLVFQKRSGAAEPVPPGRRRPGRVRRLFFQDSRAGRPAGLLHGAGSAAAADHGEQDGRWDQRAGEHDRGRIPGRSSLGSHPRSERGHEGAQGRPGRIARDPLQRSGRGGVVDGSARRHVRMGAHPLGDGHAESAATGGKDAGFTTVSGSPSAPRTRTSPICASHSGSPR